MHTSWETSESAEAYSRETAAAQWKPMGYPEVFRSLDLTGGDDRPLLDFGCGPGFVAHYAAEEYGRNVIAVDVSGSMIEYATAHYDHPLVSYREVPISGGLDFLASEEIGACMSCFVFMQMPSTELQVDACRQIRRVLTPGGRFAMLNTHPGSVGVQFSTLRNGEAGRAYLPGDPMVTSLRTANGSLTLRDFFWRVEDYAHAMEAGGFRDVAIEHLPPPPSDPTPHPQFLLLSGRA
ncbi:class I SAM-dependent methyltransferase [Polymorphospora sp. NPDC050346]|uniref:class I SAM-dependent methyltransferase n=1 Tax=Polymorphospora sp. NPDC050346 TaxID=3155780 RepID=UPI0034117902